MSIRDGLIRLLADGELHTGSALAGALGVTRGAVWKAAHRLGDLGLELRQDARGYRLERPIELLDRERILAALDAESRGACESLDVRTVATSTSELLRAGPPPEPGCWGAVLAEFQTTGRGRRGRRWFSPLGAGLCLSFAWRFASAPRDLAALSLAAGVATARALSAAGARDIRLKWPNDVLHAGAKLGGILVDVDGDSRGPLRAVIGIGLNITEPRGLAAAVLGDGGLAPAALETALPHGRIARNALAGTLLGALHEVLREFTSEGFAPFAGEWQHHDALCGRQVRVSQPNGELLGIARGIGADGALLVQRAEGLASVFSGEVSVRPAS